MNDLSLSYQISFLILLIIISACFSGSETSMLSLNKHRLKFLANKGNKNAKRALQLLSRPDRLLGVILLGNNFINILASSLATVIGIKLWGDSGILFMTVILTIVILIFGEVTPKTYAALHAEKFALPITIILKNLLIIFSPIVWFINTITYIILRPFGVKSCKIGGENLSRDELLSLIQNNSETIDKNNQDMMLGVLYLEDIKVEDIMVNRNKIIGLDLTKDWNKSINLILNSKHARLLIYDENIDDVKGILNIRQVLSLYKQNKELNKENILSILDSPYFIPEGRLVRKQLQLFQQKKFQTGLVVDEYGDIIGLLTLEDILEYIVGDLGLQEIAESNKEEKDVIKSDNDSYIISGDISVNYLNKEMDWSLPSNGQTTISGLILEELGTFPNIGTSININRYEITVLSFNDNRIIKVSIKILNNTIDDG